MLEFTDLKSELIRMVDDSSVSASNQGKYANIGYHKVRRDIVQQHPTFFESVKTTISLTSGIGALPSDFLYMMEVQDSNEVTLPLRKRNTLTDDIGGGTPIYWYFKGRTSAAGHGRQIGIKPLLSENIYVYYVALSDDLDGTSGEEIDVPDEDGQRIGLLWSQYQYYQDKRRWSDAGNALQLYTARLQEYISEFITFNEEESFGDAESERRSRFTWSNP